MREICGVWCEIRVDARCDDMMGRRVSDWHITYMWMCLELCFNHREVEITMEKSPRRESCYIVHRLQRLIWVDTIRAKQSTRLLERSYHLLNLDPHAF